MRAIYFLVSAIFTNEINEWKGFNADDNTNEN
jgi:hypothetical protein